MKKYIITSLLFLSLVSIFSGCQKELEDKYFDPERSKEANIPGFFTAILNNNRVRPSYWNVRTFLLMQPGVYSQTNSFTNANSAYQQNEGYTEQYWNNFYSPNANGSGVLGMYRAMEVAFAELDESDKAAQKIFLMAARVVLYDEASKMLHLWGDIPFSEASKLVTTDTITNAKFDEQRQLYQAFLNGLDSASTYFNTATADVTFRRYDILNSGNIEKWRMYANSIRLRLLMRISNVDEATSRTEIQKMLGNPAQYPLVDGGNAGNYNPRTSDILLMPLTNFTDNLNSALTELPSHSAPDFMLNTVMLPSNDPRIPVMFDKYGRTVNNRFIPNPTYRAMPITLSASEQERTLPDFAILDSATFLQNRGLPGIVITSSEVNFIKAEAFERWGGGDAKAAYETAVRQSISFYYYLNSLNPSFTALPAPSPAEVDTFIANANVAYAGTQQANLAKIWTQKWLHFGFLQSIQAWSEYRRTGYPQLTFPVQTLSGYENPPVRLIYPTSERSLNSTNYQAVQGKDTRNTKIFWDIN